MTRKIDDIEAEAEAEEELNMELQGQSLEERFRDLESGDSAQDDALAALKAKMGVLPKKEKVAEEEQVSERVREKVPVGRDDDGW
jgi:phage shock protein A